MEIKFLNLRTVSPATKSGEYKLNDIVQVKDIESTKYRIYINNGDYYAEVPDDNVMLIELKNKTWTLDNKEKNCKLVKCGTESTYLSEVLKKYGYNENNYNVFKNDINLIPDELYKQKRREFRED